MEEEYIQQPDVQEQTVDAVSAEAQVKEMLGADQTTFAEFLHPEQKLPKKLEQYFGIFFNREIGLTNIETNNELRNLMLHFRICKRNFFIGTPRFNITYDDINYIDQLEARVRIKALKSMGGKMRDRALFHTVLSSHERPNVPTESKGGLFSRIKRGIL
jgi:hypothetical protein